MAEKGGENLRGGGGCRGEGRRQSEFAQRKRREKKRNAL